MAHENDWVTNRLPNIFSELPWGHLPFMLDGDSRNIWTDGENTYYSYGYVPSKSGSNDYKQMVLNASKKRWEYKQWYGITGKSFYGNGVWTDGENIYYSYGSNQYVLDKATDTWVAKTWNGLQSFSGGYIWTDGENIYYSSGESQYVLDKATDTWITKTWNGLTNFSGPYIWTDDTDIYYSQNSSVQYVLDKETSTWNPKTWTGVNTLTGIGIWKWKGEIYWSGDYWGSADHRVLDKETGQWSYKNWSGVTSFYAGNVWTDGFNVYITVRVRTLDQTFSTYVLDENTSTWSLARYDGALYFGTDVWTDGTDLYYTTSSQAQYVFDWEQKMWIAITNNLSSSFSWMPGDCVWNDGDKTYYNGYIFDPSTKTFTSALSGIGSKISEYGRYVWTDGENIYCSNRSYHFILDRENNEWLTKTWSGLTSFSGSVIWTDGENIYYSSGTNHYKLNKSTSTWSRKTWYGLTTFYGNDIWTDGYNIYYSRTTLQYVLNKQTSTWSPVTWPIENVKGEQFYKIGSHLYYIYGKDEYEYIVGKMEIPYRLNFPNLEESINPYDTWLMDNDIPYRLNFPELKESIDPNDSWLMGDDIPFRLDFPPLIPSTDPEVWLIDDDIPFRRNFPPLIPSIDPNDSWLIDDDIPFRLNFPPLIPTNTPSDSWLQDKGWDPRRPWPDHRSIIQKVQTIPNIPDVDWTKSMQQTFEFYTVDPNNWYDDQKLENIISCDLTHDLTSDKRGNASITVTEPLPECYIRTYLVVTQAGYMHKICLGTYLYMTSSDSFDGMKHNITMTGYTPMVELEEKLPPLGFHIIGITNRKHSSDAPMVTDAIKDIVTTYTRCEIENRTVIQKPLLNDFVAGSNDNFLTVINNVLNASSLQQYILTVDEWGTIIVKDKPVLEDAIPTYIYTDDNSSILLPSLDTNDDIYGIPNVVEVLYTGDKRLPAIRVIVKNEDPTSIVSIPARGREIAKRFTITNIAAPVNDYSEAAVRAQVTAQAERLLEAASTINKTISYSHGYCDVKVGDTVLINYERAGVTGIRAKVVSQRISCKPGCQVDEQAVYTKKLWNRGV